MAKRGVPIAEICRVEEAMLACRPALKSVRDGAWVWRFAKGYTGRANSLQSLDPKDVRHVEARLAKHVARSRAHLIPPKFRVTPLAGKEIIGVLDKQGWEESGHCLVMACRETEAEKPAFEQADILLVSPAGKQWLGAARELLALDQESFGIYRQMMAVLPASTRGFLRLDRSGQLLCCALGVACHRVGSHQAGSRQADSHQVGALFSLTTAPAHRRKGLAREMTKRVHEWLREMGVGYFALQVEAHNEQAVSLYRSLGYQRIYDYRYRTLKET